MSVAVGFMLDPIRVTSVAGVDRFGLDDMDARILRTMIEKFGGGPVGILTIATAVGEEAETIEEVYEPFLVQSGFVDRTPRGRAAAAPARQHYGR